MLIKQIQKRIDNGESIKSISKYTGISVKIITSVFNAYITNVNNNKRKNTRQNGNNK